MLRDALTEMSASLDPDDVLDRPLARAADVAPGQDACLLTPTAAPAVAAAVQLGITMQAQQQSNWCWAAAGNTVAAFYGRSYSQNQFCNMAFGRSVDSNCPNNQASLGNDQTAFRQIGIKAGSYVSSNLGYSTIQQEIGQGRPS